jgi:hypothetical protein
MRGVTYILILSGNFMIFILALIGAQACTRERQKWRWFWVACALLSGACIAGELYQAFFPTPDRDPLGRFQNVTPM